ncbi:MAG: type II secretion system F family protein [Planctomycetota bacterium]
MKLTAARDFCQRFGVGLRAGADLLMLLDSEGRHGGAKQQSAMRQLRQGAREGRPLAQSMADQNGFFPPLLVAMTRVGEATGRLERTMLSLADHYRQQVSLRRDFQRVIAWPIIQLVMAIGVLSLLIWLMGVLQPAGGGQMTDLLGFGLRGPTGVLIFWMYIAGAVAVMVSIYAAFRYNVGGLQNIVPLLYRVPMIGGAIQTITLSRFAWTLALALDSGLDPIASIRLGLDATDSDYYRSGGDDSEQAIRGGRTLAGGLSATHLFPDEFITQVEIAELSGTDAESIDRIAKDYDERAKGAMKTIAGFATGLIWLSVAGLLIFLILRMAMNISGMYDDALAPINARG